MVVASGSGQVPRWETMDYKMHDEDASTRGQYVWVIRYSKSIKHQYSLSPKMTSNKSLKLELRCTIEIHSDQVPPWDQQQQHQTHRLLAISSLVMPAGGSTPSPGMRSSTSDLWHPAHDVTAGGSKASAMVGIGSGWSYLAYQHVLCWKLNERTNGQKHEETVSNGLRTYLFHFSGRN